MRELKKKKLVGRLTGVFFATMGVLKDTPPFRLVALNKNVLKKNFRLT
jgi:hypothetical protein